MNNVKEKLPDKRGHYKVLVNGKPMPPEDKELQPVLYDPEHGWIYDFYSTPKYKVTHWTEYKV